MAPLLNSSAQVVADFVAYRKARWARETTPFQREVAAVLAAENRVVLPGNNGGLGQSKVIGDWIAYMGDRHPIRRIVIVSPHAEFWRVRTLRAVVDEAEIPAGAEHDQIIFDGVPRSWLR